MKIEKLFDKHRGKKIYIVGTGPSMRVFPREVLDGEITIGLNQAYKTTRVMYTLTVHPELYKEYETLPGANRTQWIIKKKGVMKNLETTDKNHYVFHTSPDMETVVKRPEDTLYLGRGVQTTAIDLAARMNASAIILVGCDFNKLDGEHHGHDQHVRYHDLPEAYVFSEYREYTAKVRKSVRDRFGIPVVTLSPFVGIADAAEDYLRLKQEFGLEKLPEPKDTSGYSRKDDPSFLQRAHEFKDEIPPKG